MINDLFGVVARIFPALTVASVIAALIFLARAWSRMSSGSVGAGPTLVATPAHPGLQRIPWELQGLSEAIQSNSTQPLDLLRRRATSLGISIHVPSELPPAAAVDAILDQLESALDLPPLAADHAHPMTQPTSPTKQESLTS